MKVSKEAHVKFQAERVGNAYMLQNSEVKLVVQLSSALKAKVVEQSETAIVSNSDVQLYPEERLRLDAQQGSPNHYSYGGANSYKFLMDQRDCWVIKFRSGLNLFDLIKL